MTTKLCTTCLHKAVSDESSSQFWRCRHYEARNQDPVDGRYYYRYCTIMRMADGPCGPEGELWKSNEAPR